MIEEWRSIENYEGYQVSNLGNVKSLKSSKKRILKKTLDDNGYHKVSLYNVGICKTHFVHQMVAIAFLNHKTCGHKLVVNHIDFDRINNNISNLEIVSQRENSNKRHIKSSSKYVGVSWYNRDNKWQSRIVIDGTRKHLGIFKDELQAANAYQTALKNIK